VNDIRKIQWVASSFRISNKQKSQHESLIIWINLFYYNEKSFMVAEETPIIITTKCFKMLIVCVMIRRWRRVWRNAGDGWRFFFYDLRPIKHNKDSSNKRREVDEINIDRWRCIEKLCFCVTFKTMSAMFFVITKPLNTSSSTPTEHRAACN